MGMVDCDIILPFIYSMDIGTKHTNQLHYVNQQDVIVVFAGKPLIGSTLDQFMILLHNWICLSLNCL